MEDKKTYFDFPPVIDHEELLPGLARAPPSIFTKKIDREIIRFLGENGPSSCYSMCEGPLSPRKRGKPPRTGRAPKRTMSKALAYDYKRILRHANKLVEMGLLRLEKPKRKEVFALTFNGFHLYLWGQWKEAEQLDRAIKSNSQLLPFSQYWRLIVQIVGLNHACQSVSEAVSQQIFRRLTRLETIKKDFDLFLIEPKPVFPLIGDKKLNKEFVDFLSTTPELRNSYVSYLASHDISFLTSQNKWSEINSCLDSLESEKALAFFEKRKIQDSPLFIPGTRLKEFFPKFATLEYFFTGLLMEKLLWKEGEVQEKPSREKSK